MGKKEAGGTQPGDNERVLVVSHPPAVPTYMYVDTTTLNIAKAPVDKLFSALTHFQDKIVPTAFISGSECQCVSNIISALFYLSNSSEMRLQCQIDIICAFCLSLVVTLGLG